MVFANTVFALSALNDRPRMPVLLMTAFTTIESQRLILRRFADADLASFLAYLNDPEVARYQS